MSRFKRDHPPSKNDAKYQATQTNNQTAIAKSAETKTMVSPSTFKIEKNASNPRNVRRNAMHHSNPSPARHRDPDDRFSGVDSFRGYLNVRV